MLHSITELSKKSGISRQHIYSIKNGKVNASILTLKKLANVLGCDVLEVAQLLNKNKE